MKELTNFNAINSTGFLLPGRQAITALSLLFEKIYLPNDAEIISTFAKSCRFTYLGQKFFYCDYKESLPENVDYDLLGEAIREPLEGLSEEELETAKTFMIVAHEKLMDYGALFAPNILETDAFADVCKPIIENNCLSEGGDWDFFGPLQVVRVKQCKNDHEGEVELCLEPRAMVISDNADTFNEKIKQGYIPIVNHNSYLSSSNVKNPASAKELATLLAMKSVEMIFPSTKAAPQEIILEAREKLSDYLPPFWSSMFKLTNELRQRVKECQDQEEMIKEGQFMVDTIVRPALIDLNQKIEKERRNFFYRILTPVAKGARLMIGSPPLSQQQLITNALLLGGEVTASAVEEINKVESLKNEAGLTYLLELSQIEQKRLNKQKTKLRKKK